MIDITNAHLEFEERNRIRAAAHLPPLSLATELDQTQRERRIEEGRNGKRRSDTSACNK